MLSYDNCPDNLPTMPNWPTIDGQPLPHSTPVYRLDSADPVDWVPSINSFRIPETNEVFSNKQLITYNYRGWQNFDLETGIEVGKDYNLEAEISAANNYKESLNSHNRLLSACDVVPTLVSIGLLDALLEVEAVLAWNSEEKHPGAKWKSKSVSWHDSKAVSHLSQAQHVSLKDHETGKSHRAHACCRLLMALAHELNNGS